MILKFTKEAVQSVRNWPEELYEASITLELHCLRKPSIWSYNPIQYRIKGWQFGQVAIVTNSKLQIVVEGSSFNGGIALDDFKIYKGGCAKRPKLARGII
ncbi:hypothetical protein Avbf_12812 [Armadillidium vulgare]|nr:hypothetical protein Avbf_12812 [Armadillidium vulgare]